MVVKREKGLPPNPPPTPPPTSVPPERLCKLPVFRPVAVRLLSELAKEEPEIAHVTGLLNSDPAFSAEILTLSNSSLYARQSRIDTVQRAIIVLGMERTRALAATVALHGMVSRVRRKVAVEDSWRHSRATAIAAEWLAPFYRIHPERAYTAGIMHDIGRLGMLSAYPEYTSLLETMPGSNEDLLEEERRAFTVNHCEAGLWLTRIWGLPEEFWKTASQHHAAVTGTPGDRTDLVGLACLFAQSLGFKAAAKIESDPVESLLERIPAGMDSAVHFPLDGLAECLQRELRGGAPM